MRQSGVLMHITSLPGPHGVGTLGKSAFAFVDFLSRAGQSFWQMLPLNPTGYGDSPYQSCSAFAGNHYLIDLEDLVEQGLLEEKEISSVRWCDREDRVDFGALYENRLNVLRLAFSRFSGGEDFDRFCHENRDWLSDYALYMALKDQNGGESWHCWAAPLKFRQPEVICRFQQENSREIRFYCFVQYLFYRCLWFPASDSLKAAKKSKRILINSECSLQNRNRPTDIEKNVCLPKRKVLVVGRIN